MAHRARRPRPSSPDPAPAAPVKQAWLPYNPYDSSVTPYLHAVPYAADGGSAALAYSVVGIVNRCVDLLAQAANSMPWQIVRDGDGDDEIIATSEDRWAQHPAARAIHGVYAMQGTPLFSLWTASRSLYGETYLEKTRNEYGLNRGLTWLNPLAVTPDTAQGCITAYRYHPMQGGLSATLTPDEVAFDKTFNPNDDLRGYSKVWAALASINLTRTTQAMVRAMLENNAAPGLILSPAKSETLTEMWDERDIENLQRQIAENHKGARNRQRVLIARSAMDVTTTDAPELDRYYTIVEPLTKEICVVFGVPLAMAGDSSSTTFKDGEEVRRAFYINTVIPHLRTLQDFFNTHLMPYLDAGRNCTFRFDTAAFEDETRNEQARATLVIQQQAAGLLTLADAQRAQGLTPYPEYERMVLVNGALTPLADLRPAPVPEPPTLPPPTAFAAAVAQPGQWQPVRAVPQSPDTTPEQAAAALETWRRDAASELANWQRYARKDAARPFAPVHTRGAVADALSAALTPGGDMAAAFDAAFASVRAESLTPILAAACDDLAAHAIKDFDATRDAFEEDMLRYIVSAYDDEISRRKFTGLLHRLIRQRGPQAYRDGLADGGVSDTDVLDEDDEAVIDALISEHKGYATSFAQSLWRDTYSQNQLVQRPTMWVNKTLTAFYHAGLASADRNGLYEWQYGDTEHCSDCKRLNGQRHRMKDWMRVGWLPQSTGTRRLACGGFNCKCDLVRVRGQARGRF